MSSQVAVSSLPIPKAPIRRRSPGVFYLSISLLMLATVTYGFSRTIGPSLIHSHRAHKAFFAVHGAIFYGWMLFFVAQAALVRLRKIRWHRLLGWAGTVDGALVVPSGLYVVFASHAPLALLSVGFVSILGFAIPFSLAISWRRRPEVHRRLLLIATAVLTNAAFARFPAAFDGNYLFYLGTDLFILAGIAHDLFTQKRVHAVYRYAFPLLLAAEIAVMIPAWRYLG